MHATIVTVAIIMTATGVVSGQPVGSEPAKTTFLEPKTRLWQATPTPDGKMLVTVNGDERTLRVWDLATRKVRVWDTGATDAGSVIFTQDGKSVLVGRRDGKVSCHDLITGKEQARDQVGEPGKDKEPFFPLAADHNGDPAFVLSPDGALLALSNPNGMTATLARWPGGAVEARLKNQPRDGEIYASGARFGAGGKTLYCLCGGEARGFVAVWDLKTQKVTRTLVPRRSVSLLAVSADGRWIAVGGAFNSTVTVWDAESDFKQVELPIPRGNCAGIAFSRDGKQAATVSTSSMSIKGATAVVWDLATRSKVQSWEVTDDYWHGGIVFFTHDGRTLFTGGQMVGLHAWDLSAPSK